MLHLQSQHHEFYLNQYKYSCTYQIFYSSGINRIDLLAAEVRLEDMGISFEKKVGIDHLNLIFLNLQLQCLKMKKAYYINFG